MKYTSKQYARALGEILEKKSPEKRKAVLNNFIKLLEKQKDLKKISLIAKELERIYLTKKGLLKAEIISGWPFSKDSVNKFKKSASSFFKHKPNLIILEQKINKNLIGGFQLQADGRLIDASVKNMLVKLKRTIATNGYWLKPND